MRRANRSLALAFTLGTVFLAFVIDRSVNRATSSAPAPPTTAVPTFSGPFTSDNLTIYLVHGPDRIAGKTFLTLDEALAQKKIVVHETKNVNELSVENVSKDSEVFIQAGDIVKGGQQDRVLAFDLVVPAASGKMSLAAFCVEAGRWQRRGTEEVTSFGGSPDALASNGQKYAARVQSSQREVWRNVAKSQAGLASNTYTEVRDPRSATSLQLTLENKTLNEKIAGTVKALSSLPDKATDAIGYVAAINGKVIGADTYASAALFKKLWPKLLKAAAVEAVAELKKDAKFAIPNTDAVRAFLMDGDKGKSQEKKVSSRISQLQKEGKKVVLFECRDTANGGGLLRQSYLTKEVPSAAEPPALLNNLQLQNRR